MGKFKNAIIILKAKYHQWKRRKKLLHTDFSIISNNCWAGTAVYQPFGLKYNTPTVGLFIMDEDYIRMLENLEYYLAAPLVFITPHQSRYYDKISSNGTMEVAYPIAILGEDIEIHFMHYHSREEAETKWERRAKRINRNRLLIKMSLRDSGYDVDKMINRFLALNFANKICFIPDYVSNTAPELIKVPNLERLNLIGGDETDVTLQHIDLNKVLNSIQ